MALKVTGGPQLRARLLAVSKVGPELQARWAVDAASRIQAAAPVRTGRLRSSIRPGVRKGKVGVFGAFWGIFVDRGTKAHVILPKGISGSGRGGKSGSQVLVFQKDGQTIFAKKVTKRRQRRNPFITRGAQDALRSVGTGLIVKAWNRRSNERRFTKLVV